MLNNELVTTLNMEGFNRIVIIYDYDNIRGITGDILTLEQFLHVSVKKLENVANYCGGVYESAKRLESLGIELYFIPVVYCAESIALYSQIITESSLPIEWLVCSGHTVGMHQHLCERLACSQFTNYVVKLKRFASWLNFEEVLKKLPCNTLNDPFVSWLSSGCSDNTVFLNFEQAVDHLKQTRAIFELAKQSDIVLSCDSKDISLMGKTYSSIMKEIQSLTPGSTFALSRNQSNNALLLNKF